MVYKSSPNEYYQGDIGDLPDMRGPFASRYEHAFHFVDATASLPVVNGEDSDILVFETQQVAAVKPEEEPGRFTIFFKEVIHGKRNKEIAVTTATISFLAISGCVAGMYLHGQHKHEDAGQKP